MTSTLSRLYTADVCARVRAAQEETAMATSTSSPVDWTAVQTCGDCGVGKFRRTRYGAAICTTCGHEHPMSRHNLDDREVFGWTTTRSGQYLTVTCYAPADTDA